MALRVRAAALLALAVLFAGCGKKSLTAHNRSTQDTVLAVDAAKRAALPPTNPLPEIGPPHLDSVPRSGPLQPKKGPLFLEKLPPSARPHVGPPRAPGTEGGDAS